jgi:hypothetical protein
VLGRDARSRVGKCAAFGDEGKANGLSVEQLILLGMRLVVHVTWHALRLGDATQFGAKTMNKKLRTMADFCGVTMDLQSST